MRIETQSGSLKLEIDYADGKVYGDIYYEDSSRPENTTLIPQDELPPSVQEAFRRVAAEGRKLLTEAQGLLEPYFGYGPAERAKGVDG